MMGAAAVRPCCAVLCVHAMPNTRTKQNTPTTHKQRPPFFVPIPPHPAQEELSSLRPGETVQRVPARPPARPASLLEAPGAPPPPDPFEGTWEALSLDAAPPAEGGGGGGDGGGSGGSGALLDRRDVWGWSPPAAGRPPNLRGLRFDN